MSPAAWATASRFGTPRASQRGVTSCTRQRPGRARPLEFSAGARVSHAAHRVVLWFHVRQLPWLDEEPAECSSTSSARALLVWRALGLLGSGLRRASHRPPPGRREPGQHARRPHDGCDGWSRLAIERCARRRVSSTRTGRRRLQRGAGEGDVRMAPIVLGGSTITDRDQWQTRAAFEAETIG